MTYFENLKTLWNSPLGKFLFLVFILGLVIYGIQDVPAVAEYQWYFYLGSGVSGYLIFRKLSSPVSKAKPSTPKGTSSPGKSLGREGVRYLETLPVEERDGERSKLLKMGQEERMKYIARSQTESLSQEFFGRALADAQPKIQKQADLALHRKNAETNLWAMPIVVSLAVVSVVIAILYYTVAITIWILPLAITIGGGTFLLMAIRTWGKEAILPRLRTGTIVIGVLGIIWLFSSGKFEDFVPNLPQVQKPEVQVITPTPLPKEIEVETSPGFSPEELANINIGLSKEAENQLRVVHETNTKATQLIAETLKNLRSQFESDPYNQYHLNYGVLLEGEGNAIGSLQVAEILHKWFYTHHMENTTQGLVWVEGNPFNQKVKALEAEGFITTVQAGQWLDQGEKEVVLAQIRVQLLQDLQQSNWNSAKVTLAEFNRTAVVLGHSPFPSDMVEILKEANGGRVRPVPTPVPYQAQVLPVQTELEAAAGTPTPIPTPTPAPTPMGLCSEEAPFKLGETCMNWPTAREQVVSILYEEGIAESTGWFPPDPMAPEVTRFLQMAVQQNYRLEGPLESARAMATRAKSGEATALMHLGFTQTAPQPTPTLPPTATEKEVVLPDEDKVRESLGNMQASYYWVPESWIRNNGSPTKEMRVDYRLALSIMLERLGNTNTDPYTQERIASSVLYNCVFSNGRDSESCNLVPAWDAMIAQFGESK